MIYSISPIASSAIVLGVMIGIFLLVFLLNKKTPVPEGCEDLEAECATCPVKTCLKNTNKEESEEK